MQSLPKLIRQLLRSCLVLGVFAGAGLHYLGMGGWNWNARQRALWLQRWATRFAGYLGVRLTVKGHPPSAGFIAPNHLSYLDILVLGSIEPLAFLSKSEVRHWPIVGAYTRMAGTLFIDRRRRKDVANKEGTFRAALQSDLGIVFFLEGTTSDGNEVLPFRASLLEPAVQNQWPVTPAYLEYECVGGDPAADICWWGDMTFTPHLWKLMGLERIDAKVVFGKTITAEGDRKELAERLREAVVDLRDDDRSESALSSIA